MMLRRYSSPLVLSHRMEGCRFAAHLPCLLSPNRPGQQHPTSFSGSDVSAAFEAPSQPPARVVSNAWGTPRAIPRMPSASGTEAAVMPSSPSASCDVAGASPSPTLPAAGPVTTSGQPHEKAVMHSHVLDLIEVCVPTVFTAVTQIARRVPDAVMEALGSLPEGGAGLSGYLTSHPTHFAVTRIGKAVVARRLHAQTTLTVTQASALVAQLTREVVKESVDPTGEDTFTGKEKVVFCRSTPTSPAHTVDRCRFIPKEVSTTIPPFLIPVKALLNSSSFSSLAECKEFLRKHEKLLRHVNPFTHNGTQSLGGNAASTEPEDSLWIKGFVSIHPDVQRGAAAQLQEDAASVAERFAACEVQDYEWYRVARLLPCANREVPFTRHMMLQARSFLPPGRSLLHVLYSAPHLFHVHITDDFVKSWESPLPLNTTDKTEDDDVELSLPVRCQFTLDPSFVLSVKETKEELSQALVALTTAPAERAAGSGQRKPVDRARRRTLRRKLHYLENISPCFDDRVLAVQLLDAMPANEAISVSTLVSELPGAAWLCLPGNLRSMFNKFPEYFVYFYDGVSDGPMVQRADLPPPSLRTLDSIGAEEILQEVFLHYPSRFHPESGTCMHRCLTALPHPHRQRVLWHMRDVGEEILRRYPEKVEILPTAHAMGGLLLDKKKVTSMLQDVHGRQDLLLPFRFVGEWQEKLIERYRRFCAKHKYETPLRNGPAGYQ